MCDRAAALAEVRGLVGRIRALADAGIRHVARLECAPASPKFALCDGLYALSFGAQAILRQVDRLVPTAAATEHDLDAQATASLLRDAGCLGIPEGLLPAEAATDDSDDDHLNLGPVS